METELPTPGVEEKGREGVYMALRSQYRLLEETNEEKKNDLSKRSQNLFNNGYYRCEVRFKLVISSKSKISILVLQRKKNLLWVKVSKHSLVIRDPIVE